MRLSASLRGLPVGVGYVDCEQPTNSAFCRSSHGIPERPHAPEFHAWPRGGAKPPRGETLFAPSQIEAHRALELIERGMRLALASEREPLPHDGEGGGGEGGGEGASFERDVDPRSGGDAAGAAGGFRWEGMPQRDPNAKPLPWGGPTRPDATQRIDR